MIYVPRKLWFQRPGDTVRIIVAEGDLPSLSKAIIVLGEPGMGKTALLSRLAKADNTAFCTARKLINTHDPAKLIGDATKLIIDALDEVAANREGAAIDLVVQKLDAVGNPPLILSCRVADWQAATSTQTIKEMYETEPLVVHLMPFERTDQIAILAGEVGSERAEKLLTHFEAVDLDLLGNPQNLLMIARLSDAEPLPTTRGDLFEKAIDQLWCEHQNSRGAIELDRESALDAAGAAFATLILTGSSAIVRHGAAHLGDGELAFSEVDPLANGNLARIIGSRLFEGGEDSFTYWHRRIGEFLGARWLAKCAETPAKRRRLVHLFQSHGLVPASLRGLHAWLARDPKLAHAIIAADPMGVVEYGDADSLTEDQARVLFDGMRRIFQETSQFHQWNEPRARALVSGSLRADAELILRDRTAPFSLRTLLLEQFRDRALAEGFQATLQSLVYDETEVFAIRRDAGSALVTLGGGDWRAMLENLRQRGTGNSLRLAFELMLEVGLATFSDEQVVAIIFAYDGHTVSPLPRQSSDKLPRDFWRVAAQIPPERLNGWLEVFTSYAVEMLPKDSGIDHHALLDLAHELIHRWVETGNVDPLQIWSRLEPYAEQYHYHSDRKARLAEWFRAHDVERRAIQRHVLLNCSPSDIWSEKTKLGWGSPGLSPNDADTAKLIEALPNTKQPDQRWRTILAFTVHDGEKGQIAREAAKRFVTINPQLVKWIERPEVRQQSAWEIKEAKRKRRAVAKKAVQHAEARREFALHLEDVRAGEFRWVVPAASAYLKLFNDLPDVDPPWRRIADWLGTATAMAAIEGIEAFLVKQPVRPTAMRIALAHAKGREYRAGYVIVVALAERIRSREIPFDDLSDERLMAGVFTLWHSPVHTHAGLPDLYYSLEGELRRRGCWEQAIRLFVSPQLKHRKPDVQPLHELMRSEIDKELAAQLALEWLRSCPDLHEIPESEMIDRALHSSDRGDLGVIAEQRRTTALDDERRRNWDAVQVFVDITGASARLNGIVQPELLWHLRAREQERRFDEKKLLKMSVQQLTWIVSSFRKQWPYEPPPIGSSWGDQNPWHATDYLKGLIDRLGEDTSEEATQGLRALLDRPEDGYTDRIKAVLAEQRRKRVEQIYVPPKVAEIRAIVEAGPPITSSDLQAVMLENLATVQKKLKGDDVDWYRGFYREDARHKDEEPCRDEVIKMLRATDSTLEYMPETHVADDKRVDIVARASRQPILPIEIKGTWHPKLWTAADEQLSHLYVEDWRAERGIYLILWFGPDPKMPKPPAEIALPTTSEELRQALIATSCAAREGEIDIFVIDIQRPSGD